MNGYRHYVFSGNERFIERPVSRQLAGKALRRELRETTGKWRQAWRIGDDAIEELAHGLLETPKQIKYAKEIERITGQWTANSPAARWALATYSPFGMWTRAATKFVFLTLPVHHPIKTAIIANIEQMTAPERQAMGLSYFTDTDRPVPDNLMGSIPLPGGGLQPVGGLTSFGYFADPGTALSTAVLPQLAGALDNLRGLDYTGGKLVHEDGTPFTQQERWLEAMRSTVESLAPGLAPASRAIERGPVAALSPRSTPLDPGLVDWLRDQADSRQITVPAHPSGSSSSGSSPWTAGSPSGSSAPWTK